MEKKEKMLSALVVLLALCLTAAGALAVSSETELKDALAKDSPISIQLSGSFSVENTIVIPAGKTVTLDLNGKTIDYTKSEKITANHEMLLNQGNLTILDSSVSQTGAIVYHYTGEGTNYAYASNTITNHPGATLTINSGTYENKTATSGQISYVVDNRTNGSQGDAIVKITGGIFESKKGIGVRNFANSTTCTTKMTITGGDFTGGIQVHDANTSANKAQLNISNATVDSTGYGVYLYGDKDSSGINVQISNSNISGEDAAVFFLNMNATDASQYYTAEIISGTFSGDVWSTKWDSSADGGNGAYTENIPAVSGGSFSTDITEILKDGVNYTLSGGQYYVGDTKPGNSGAGSSGGENVVIAPEVEFPTNSTISVPKTGDSTPLVLLMCLLVLSCGGIIILKRRSA